MLNQPCILGLILTWSCDIIHLISAHILLRKFACFMRYPFLWFSFIVVYFSGYCIRIMLASYNGFGKCSSFIFWKSLYKSGVIFFFNIYGAIQIVCFICVRFGKLRIFHKICPFHLNHQISWHKLLQILLYFPFKICRFYSNSPPFIPEIDNLSFFSFFNQYSYRGFVNFIALVCFLFHWFYYFLPSV